MRPLSQVLLLILGAVAWFVVKDKVEHFAEYWGRNQVGPWSCWAGYLPTAPPASRPPPKKPHTPTTMQAKIEEFAERLTMLFVTTQIISLLNGTHQEIGGEEMPEPLLTWMDSTRFLQVSESQPEIKI